MSNTPMAGTSAFFANREGNHNWLDNDKRPFLSVIRTDRKGQKEYTDLFLNTAHVSVTVRGNKVTLSFDKKTNHPLFRVLERA